MRGTIGGKRNAVTDAVAGVNRAMEPPFEVSLGGSNTLQGTDSEAPESLRASFIEATVKAIADGSGPRLDRSRS
jgi:hypothetical protein